MRALQKISLFILFAIVLLSFLVPFLYPDGEWTTQMENSFAAPSLMHPFGFDHLGRDLLLRCFFGARMSLMLGISCALLAAVIGFLVGGISGFIGGKADQYIMRSLEILLALPSLIWMSLIVLILQKQSSIEFAMIVAISLSTWMLIAKHVRALVLRERFLPYIEAERALGASPARILFRHILPNIRKEFFVYMGSALPSFILYESLLSFIGIGLQPPTASWGILIQEGWKNLAQYPHLVLMPSLLLFLTVFSLNVLATRWAD